MADPRTPFSIFGRAEKRATEHSGSEPPRPAPELELKAVEVKETPSEGGPSFEILDPRSNQTITVRGEILTAPGGPLETTDNLRDLCALTSSGQFFVLRGYELNPRVRSLHVKAETLGFMIFDTISVDTTTLKAIYSHASKRGAVIGSEELDATRMQRDLVELIAHAVQENASDIHIVANADKAEVRMRIDGAVGKVREVPADYAKRLLQTAFAMADQSDAAYQPLAFQGARFSSKSVALPAGLQAVRLQWNPLANDGRYLAMRLLYASQHRLTDIDALGYSAAHLKMFKVMRAQRTGINIISGPTGSGKSTTLKESLINVMRELNHEVNCLTVEDPPEYVIDPVQQMPVQNATTPEERSIKFQIAISAAMRSDPDILMIGEIRDEPSAKLAFEAAMTGHQVWTSLHANNAMIILDRLRDIGVESYKLFDPAIVTGLISQRLTRKLCPDCRLTLEDAAARGLVDADFVARARDILERSGIVHPLFHRGPGCGRCKNGFVGRTVVAEIILPDQTFLDLYAEGRKAAAREHWIANLGGGTMLAHAWTKALRGEIGPAQIEQDVGLLRYEAWMADYIRRALAA